MKWEPGRSGGGYFKWSLVDAYWPFRWDMHVLKMPPGSEVKPHVDKIAKGKHWRLNIALRLPSSGGEFVCPRAKLNWRRVKLFRPDVQRHWVSKVEGEKTRYMLSIGWAR